MGAKTSAKSAEKILKLAILMNSKSEVTIARIMKEFSVSRATAFRMKKSMLSTFGGRIEYERLPPDDEEQYSWGAKRHGGKGRENTFKIWSPGTDLTFDDVGLETVSALKTAHAQLSAAGLKREASELNLLLAQVNKRLQNRLATGIPAETLLETSGVGRRVSQRVLTSPEVLTSLQNAILDNRAIRFRYWLRNQRKAITYRVDPLGVIFHRFAYLVCIRHDARRKGPITLRVDEISTIEALKDRRKVPVGFNLQGFADQSFGAFFGEEPLSVIWRFSAVKADEAAKFIFHPSQTQERQDDGSLLVHFTAKGSVEMCWELFQWGRDVEIVAPERLKREYIRLCAEIVESAQRYHVTSVNNLIVKYHKKI